MSQSERHGERPRRLRPPDAEMGAFEAAEGALLESGVSPESCCARGIGSNSSLLGIPTRHTFFTCFILLIIRLTRRAPPTSRRRAAVPGQTIAVY